MISRPNPRRWGLAQIFVLFLAFCAHVSYARSSLLGIDLGTEYIKAVLVKPGIPFEIVLSKSSERKEPAILTFKPDDHTSHIEGALPQRFYGRDSLAFNVRFPSSSYSNLKQLLGLSSDNDPTVSQYRLRYPDVKVIKVEETGRIGFDGSIVGEGNVFTVEELLAMELRNIKLNAQALAGDGSLIGGVVITVPPFYTTDEKRAVLAAADLADLKVLSLLSDGIAVGFQYATDRTFPNPASGGTPERHMVFDIGSGSTSVTILQFESRDTKERGRQKKTTQEITTKGTAWDRTLGGDYLTSLIVDDMVAKFSLTPNAKSIEATVETVKSDGRAMTRLWRDAQKIRQVLSANTQASIGTESLFPDIDFRYTLSRADFEAMASDFALRVETTIQLALERAKTKVEELDSIILFGGVTRTPFVRRALESLAGVAKIRTNVNSDEAAAFGATFRAAQLSSMFRTRAIGYADSSNSAFYLEGSSNGAIQRQPIFTITDIEKSRNVTFSDYDTTTFNIVEELPSGDYTLVQVVELSGAAQSFEKLETDFKCPAGQALASFSVKIDTITALPQISAVFAQCDVSEGDGFKTVQVPISFKVSPLSETSLTPSLLAQSKERINRLDHSDRLHQQHSELVNDLEAYVYESQGLVENEKFIQATTPENIREILRMSTEIADWLSNEGYSESLEELQKRYDSLSTLVKPVTDSIEAAELDKRRLEEEARQSVKLVTAFKSVLNQAKGMIDVVRQQAADSAPSENSKDEPVSDLMSYSVEDMSKLEGLYAEYSTWLDAKLVNGEKGSYPVKEIQEKTLALQGELMEMVNSKMKFFEELTGKRGGKANGKSKSRASASESSSSNEAFESSTSTESPSDEPSTSSSEPIKDEL